MRKAIAIGLYGLSMLGVGACADRNARTLPSPVDARAPDVGSAASVAAFPAAPLASASVPAPVPAAKAEWIEAIRLERWDEAQTLLDALPESDRNRPELRFSRARVEFERRDAGKGGEF